MVPLDGLSLLLGGEGPSPLGCVVVAAWGRLLRESEPCRLPWCSGISGGTPRLQQGLALPAAGRSLALSPGGALLGSALGVLYRTAEGMGLCLLFGDNVLPYSQLLTCLVFKYFLQLLQIKFCFFTRTLPSIAFVQQK